MVELKVELEGVEKFLLTIQQSKNETFKNSILFRRRLAFGIYRRAVKRSPVDTGYFRLHWNLSLNSPNRTVEGERTKDGAYQAPNEGQAISAIAGAGVSDDIFICNPVEYGVFLEAGSSDKAPEGVLGLSIMEEVEAASRIVSIEEYQSV